MAGREGDSKRWSATITLEEAVARAPVFIRLEEGSRGDVEELSFSAGDCMALEGERMSKGRRLVLAHYSSEMEGEDSGLYHALVTLPYDLLPDLDVSVLEDPQGDYYRSYVNTNFPGFSWSSVDEDEYNYTNIRLITPFPPRKPKAMPRSTDLTKPSRPPPPPPDQLEPRTPPAVPPKPGASKASHPLPALPRSDSQYPSLPGDNPPPIPPRKLKTKSSAQECGSVYEVAPTDVDEALFNMPTLAELYTSSSSSEISDVPANQIKEKAEKKKKGFAKAVVEKAKEVYRTVSKGGIDSRSPTMNLNQSSDYLEVLGDDEDDDEDDDRYEVLDESMMLPDIPGKPKPPYIKQEKKREEKTDGNAKKGAKNKDEVKQTIGKKKMPANAVKPTVRVSPQVTEGVPLKGQTQPRSPSERPPFPAPHLSMSPGGQNVSEVVTKDPERSSPLADLSCSDLCSRLQVCGMPDLAKICQDKWLDGQFFLTLTDEEMKKPPFSLSDFDVKRKLKMVKSGWVPK